jgi:hypothetical protein
VAGRWGTVVEAEEALEAELDGEVYAVARADEGVVLEVGRRLVVRAQPITLGPSLVRVHLPAPSILLLIEECR